MMLLKIFISLLFTVLIFYHIDIEQLNKVVSDTELIFILGTIVASVLMNLSQALRLCSILSVKVTYVINLQFVSLFFSNFMPTNIGSDLYKAVALRKYKISIKHCAKLILIDRFFGFWLICLLGIFISWVKPNREINSILGQYSEIAHIGFFCFLLVFLFYIYFFSSLTNVSTRREWRAYWVCNILSYLFQVTKFKFIFLSLNLEFDIFNIAILLFSVQFFSLIPVSFGGLGVLEGGMTAVLVFLGIDVNEAVAVAIINRFILILTSLFGGVLFFKERNNHDIDS